MIQKGARENFFSSLPFHINLSLPSSFIPLPFLLFLSPFSHPPQAAVKVVDLEVLNRVFFDLIQCDIPISSLHASIQREIQVLSVLHHVNIIALEDSFTIDNRVYICMEFVEGKDLLSAIPPNGYPENVAKNLFFQLGSAVSYCRLANVRSPHF